MPSHHHFFCFPPCTARTFDWNSCYMSELLELGLLLFVGLLVLFGFQPLLLLCRCRLVRKNNTTASKSCTHNIMASDLNEFLFHHEIVLRRSVYEYHEQNEGEAREAVHSHSISKLPSRGHASTSEDDTSTRLLIGKMYKSTL